MRAMVLTGIRGMEMRDVPDPHLQNPTDVKIRMEAVGVCGARSWNILSPSVMSAPAPW